MSKIKRHQTSARMSGIAIHGDTVYMAGAVADDANADAGEQTRQVLAKIDALLATAGSSKSKLLWAQLWVTDMRNFAAMNEVWDGWIDPENPPVRAGLCSDLAAPGYLVEIMVMAAK